MKNMKYIEVVFDVLYLLAAIGIGLILMSRSDTRIAGVMAVILGGGDSFHLVPRIASIISGDKDRYRKSLGIGKAITSITMTVFYVLLWNIGTEIYGVDAGNWNIVVYVLAIIRVIISLLPENDWSSNSENIKWGIYRNIPFTILGAMVTTLFYINRASVYNFRFMWIAIILSFAFYIPVVLWSHKKPMLGILMLPKSCVYIYMLTMFL